VDDFEKAINEAEWSWIEPHLKRDAVIVVAVSLDLAVVAEKVATDDKKKMEFWITQGLIGKPGVVQVETWAKTPQKKFLTVIVQPYVLVQEYFVH
jgi:hypothetical protein